MSFTQSLLKTTAFLIASFVFAPFTHATSDPLNYRSIAPYYVPAKPSNVTTLLGLIQSRPDLSRLAEALGESGGFLQAFDTTPTWTFTFFAPNNDAFESTGLYFDTFQQTP
jgi:hypothetical protein